MTNPKMRFEAGPDVGHRPGRRLFTSLAITCAALFIGCGPIPPPEQADTNADGWVDELDFAQATRCLGPATDEYPCELADVDRDGHVDARDLGWIGRNDGTQLFDSPTDVVLGHNGTVIPNPCVMVGTDDVLYICHEIDGLWQLLRWDIFSNRWLIPIELPHDPYLLAYSRARHAFFFASFSVPGEGTRPKVLDLAERPAISTHAEIGSFIEFLCVFGDHLYLELFNGGPDSVLSDEPPVHALLLDPDGSTVWEDSGLDPVAEWGFVTPWNELHQEAYYAARNGGSGLDRKLGTLAWDPPHVRFDVSDVDLDGDTYPFGWWLTGLSNDQTRLMTSRGVVFSTSDFARLGDARLDERLSSHGGRDETLLFFMNSVGDGEQDFVMIDGFTLSLWRLTAPGYDLSGPWPAPDAPFALISWRERAYLVTVADGDLHFELAAEFESGDRDADGVPDESDIFPLDPSISVDTDGDGHADFENEDWPRKRGGWINTPTSTGAYLDEFPDDPEAVFDPGWPIPIQ